MFGFCQFKASSLALNHSYPYESELALVVYKTLQCLTDCFLHHQETREQIISQYKALIEAERKHQLQDLQYAATTVETADKNMKVSCLPT
jgi:hypothetical protein